MKKLPNSVHASRPWRIRELTNDFRLEDVWELTTLRDRDDFPRLVEVVSSYDPAGSSSIALRTLFAIRFKLGELFEWDGHDASVGARVASLRDRLPADLRDAPPAVSPALAFSPLYLTDDECAAEIANQTVHGILHLGLVPDGTGGFQVQMAIYVKPNGLFGEAYMAAIRPFRYAIVYPAMLRELERAWHASVALDLLQGAST